MSGDASNSDPLANLPDGPAVEITRIGDAQFAADEWEKAAHREATRAIALQEELDRAEEAVAAQYEALKLQAIEIDRRWYMGILTGAIVGALVCLAVYYFTR